MHASVSLSLFPPPILSPPPLSCPLPSTLPPPPRPSPSPSPSPLPSPHLTGQRTRLHTFAGVWEDPATDSNWRGTVTSAFKAALAATSRASPPAKGGGGGGSRLPSPNRMGDGDEWPQVVGMRPCQVRR
jgi:hypothetical protein